MPGAPASEVIRDLLGGCRLSATVYSELSACGSWNFGTSGARSCVFHVVVRGSGWIQLEREPPVLLEAGDLVLLPRNAYHELRPQQDRAVSITCGELQLEDVRVARILEALPELVIVRARYPQERTRIVALATLLAAEAGARSRGDAVVRDKLVELFLAIAVRAHLESPEHKRALLMRLADPRLGHALGAMHREPERRWHIATLAALAGMSRSSFVDAFSAGMGMPPMHYLSAVRMQRAAALLKDRRNSVGSVAARLGYRSEAAFRRAFKRIVGCSPGVVRRTARAYRLAPTWWSDSQNSRSSGAFADAAGPLAPAAGRLP